MKWQVVVFIIGVAILYAALLLTILQVAKWYHGSYTGRKALITDPASMHIFGQKQWHAEAYIVANTAALTRLRDAISAALISGVGHTLSFTNDGEGYMTLVIKEDDVKVFDTLSSPYTEAPASEVRKDALKPWNLPGVMGKDGQIG